MADGGNVIAKAYVAIIPTMEGSQKSIATQLTGATEPASKEAGEKSGKSFGESLAKGLKTTGALIAGAMATATATAVATGKAFVNSAKEVASYGDSVAKESAKMNLSVQGYQELSYILQRNGASIDSMKSAMLKLTKAAEANDDAFKELGISQEQLKNMSPEETLNETIRALQNMDDVTKRTALASKLLGKAGGTELAPLLNSSAEETEALRKQVHELGGVMSDEAVKDSEKFKDEMLNMDTALSGLKRNMISQFLPGLTTAMQGLSKVFAGDESGIGQISEGIKSVIGKISEMSPKILKVISDLVMNTLQGFAPMLPSIVSTIFSFISQAILTVTSLLPQLTPIITEGLKGIGQALVTALPIIIQSIIQLANELITWLAGEGNVQMLVGGIVQMVQMILNNISVILPPLIVAIASIIGELAKSLSDPDNVQMLLDAVLTICGTLAVGIWQALPILGEAILGVIKNLGELLSRFFEFAVPLVADGIGKIVETVKGWGNSIKTFILNLINGIKSTIVGWIDTLKSNFMLGFNAIRDGVSSVIEKVKGFVSDAISTLKELPSKAIQIGKDLISGLIGGITQMAKKAVDSVKSLGGKLVGGLKSVLGIHSPSRVFRELGEQTAEGYRLGYESEMSDIEDDMLFSMEGLTGNLTATVDANTTATPINGSQTVNGGSITINVYGSEGQNINDLANIIAFKLEEMTKRKGAVYA